MSFLGGWLGSPGGGGGASGVTVWSRIGYHLVAGAAETTHTFSGLDGDVDREYQITAKLVNTLAGPNKIVVRPNNDTTVANYTSQYIQGNDATPSANVNATEEGIVIGFTRGSGFVAQGGAHIFAASGTDRIAETSRRGQDGASNIGFETHLGWLWLNDADNITSLVVMSPDANALGIGTELALWTPRTL